MSALAVVEEMEDHVFEPVLTLIEKTVMPCPSMDTGLSDAIQIFGRITVSF